MTDPTQCEHPLDKVSADICEGDARYAHVNKPYMIKWCRLCGAYSPGNSHWILPLEEEPLKPRSERWAAMWP